MILKKLFTENSKNPEKSFLSRKRRAGGKKVPKYLYLLLKKIFLRGAKKKTERRNPGG